jgi:hypothetical protein
MEELAERLTWMMLGGAVGFVLGYIVARLRDIKEELDEVDDTVKHLRSKDESGILRARPIVLDVVLVGVVCMVVWASFASQKAVNAFNEEQHSDVVALCKSGVESRDVQRSLVDAIYELATGSLERPKNAPPLTKQELKQYNDYIDRVNKFRVQTYNRIRPSETCESYVKDDNVEPPTSDFPHISNKE